MVAVDETGKATAVPPFKPSTPNENRRFEEAKLRKALRRELAARHRAMKHAAQRIERDRVRTCGDALHALM